MKRFVWPFLAAFVFTGAASAQDHIVALSLPAGRHFLVVEIGPDGVATATPLAIVKPGGIPTPLPKPPVPPKPVPPKPPVPTPAPAPVPVPGDELTADLSAVIPPDALANEPGKLSASIAVGLEAAVARPLSEYRSVNEFLLAMSKGQPESAGLTPQRRQRWKDRGFDGAIAARVEKITDGPGEVLDKIKQLIEFYNRIIAILKGLGL
jgi:hypothetical protein